MMLRNYLQVLTRNALRSKAHTFINIAGFAIGIACVLLIALYVHHELSFDRHHSKHKRIFRITEQVKSNGVGESSSSVPIPTGPTLQAEYPNLITHAARILKLSSSTYLSVSDKRFNERDVLFADSSLLDVFDFRLLRGDSRKVLREPNQILLTPESARRYFGDADPLGQIIRYQDQIDLVVVGIVEAPKATDHFSFNALISFSTLRGLLTGLQLSNFFWNPAYTYLLLPDDAHAKADYLKSVLPAFMNKYFNAVKVANKILTLQPLADIHLHSLNDNELRPPGNLKYIYILETIGVLILSIAIINFVNLSTARAVMRAKEVGVRKVLGSKRNELVLQFLGESTIIALISTLVASMIAYFTLPLLNELLGYELNASVVAPHITIASLGAFAILIGVVAGIYPAICLSAFEAVIALKGNIWSHTSGMSLRKFLVIFQFTIAIALITGAIVIQRQLVFLQKASTGFNSEGVIVIPIQRSALSSVTTFRAFRERLLQIRNVEHVTAFEEIPGKAHNAGSYTPEGSTEPVLLPRLFVREDFGQTFDLTLVAGRYFNDAYTPGTASREVMINEAMVKQLGWNSPENAVGRKIGDFKRDSVTVTTRVVGVVKDFHVRSLHEPLKPFVLEGPPSENSLNMFLIKYMAVKLGPGGSVGTIKEVENAWNAMVHDKVFEFTFLDEELQSLYDAEYKFSAMSKVFSGLSILVACLGLFGLTSYTVGRRSKEISIRKVLGSSSPDIVILLSRNFLENIVIANALSIPVTYFALQAWLETFASHTTLHWSVFLYAFAGTLMIAFMTISFQTISAALVNPSKILRNE